MVLDGMIISIIVGFIRRGNLKELANLRIKGGLIFPILFVLEILIFIFQNRFPTLLFLSNYIYIFIYVLGLIFLYLNRNYKGFKLILLGVFLNFLVMAINGGRMPVSLDVAYMIDPVNAEYIKNGGMYAKHQVLTANTHLGFLGDIIPITHPYPKMQAISIGDVIMNIGIFIFVQWLMVTKHRTHFVKGGETT
ncbi:DUF5317 domain-containing protein [Ectobacillus sp. sgz5001026]|uniref:DUF5317 domain-containing protein n=1 Tax=Ectobacillus sp. sgz5001026 TaxID=3242473 RepID=UPI0036D39B13